MPDLLTVFLIGLCFTGFCLMLLCVWRSDYSFGVRASAALAAALCASLVVALWDQHAEKTRKRCPLFGEGQLLDRMLKHKHDCPCGPKCPCEPKCPCPRK